MTDPIVEAVVAKFRQRSAVGLGKYGVRLDRPDLTLTDWLRHQQEELMDAVNYIECAIRKLEPDKPNGLAAVFGKWPGDETDEQIDSALKDIS